MTIVGRVAALWRYPVKSMGAEPLDAVDVSWHGLTGDRRWAFVRPDVPQSGFPWLTIRESPRMWHYRAELVDPDHPDTSVTLVHTPDGGVFDVVDPELASELGAGVRVIRQNVGVFDTFPLSLLTTRTVDAIGAASSLALDARRFRPNVLIEPLDDAPFAEDAWLGAELQLGTLRMRVDKRDKRCVMVNVDPETTTRDASVLKAISRERQSCLGVYGTTVEPGRIAVGDEVRRVR